MGNNSNFSFLTEHRAFLLDDARQVEGYALRDPRAAAIFARRTLERSLKWLFANDTALKAPYEKSLAAMIHEPTFATNIKQGLFHDIKFIHCLGNVAVHGDQTISSQESLKATVSLHTFLGWLARVYTRGGAAPEQFQILWLPEAEVDDRQLTKQQLEKIQLELQAKDKATEAAHKKLSQTEAELAELKDQLTLLQQIKETNKKTIGSNEYTEAQTRELIIDVMLREAGWDPKVEDTEEYEVTNCMPTSSGERTGTGYVDYVLWGLDGKPLALVEAKKTRKDPKAKNTKHADFIVEQFDKNYPHYAGKFCQKIDFSVKYAQSLIDEFSIKEKYPQIAVSVDMLDTGIDVPEVVNLVFFKLVRSKTKFWQMVGRGTRLCEDLFAQGEDKQEYIIFDYCQNLDFFDANPDGYESRVQEPLKQRIFKRRLDLVVALQNGQPDDDAMQGLVEQLKDQMHGIVETMNLDNFIVRKHRKDVETFAQRDKWAELTEADIEVLAANISGLPSPDDDDEFCRRFDLLILNLQLAILQGSRAQESYRDNVISIAKDLEGKSAIPSVARQLELILDIQTAIWWQDVTLTILEDVRLRLRGLIRFIDPEQAKNDVYTNFQDAIGDDTGEYKIVKTDANLEGYRKRVQRFIQDHQDHVTIRRLKNNEPVSAKDIESLENILFSGDGPIPREEYENIYGDRPLGVLVRSVVGLDRNAAKSAFAEFLSEAPLQPDQMTFLNEIVDYLVKNGVMEPKTMFDSPFTNINDQGVIGVFGENDSKKIIELVRHINENAGVAS